MPHPRPPLGLRVWALGVVVVVLSTAAAYFLWLQKRSKSGLSIKWLDPAAPRESPAELGDSHSVFIYPPAPGQLDISQDELDNVRFTKQIELLYPHRFDVASWSCAECKEALSPYGTHYRCGECDKFILCEPCYQRDAQSIHQKLSAQDSEHGEEFIYRNTTFPNDMKRRLLRTFSCAATVNKAFEFYKERPFIGEKVIPKESLPNFKREGGVDVGSFRYYSFGQVQGHAQHLAHALAALGLVKYNTIGICAQNRLEWCLVDLCSVLQVSLTNSLSF